MLTPLPFRKRALRLLAGKVALAARVDVYGSKPAAAAAAAAAAGAGGDGEEEDAAANNISLVDNPQAPGEVGRALRDFIVQALMKAQEPPPAPVKKALPAPEDRAKPKRGGKRHRRLKEKRELSEIQKQLNRVKFGEQEDTVGLKGARRQQQLHPKGVSSAAAASGSSSSTGFASSLSFTPVQGLELCNPLAEQQQQQQQQQSDSRDYFGGGGRFTAVERSKAAAHKA
ncbi:hypothetical protein ETH_00027530 [Eimeria tenella]|uniref:Prp31 C-terminal domain-containing protein n=1 Tax=Eimeria tenella TaxID=5802 RepID=U6L7G0_EIMTE|nr:hypothetical protein ETH_00027530 [Eimeria tenella]CDJ43725.1 hypothetical protein ETH_00027530 [Eimeria tenella]|eukprot:XP_013234474.1 hypothetical protein ETH_00027530 [Eimeria tenella]